MRKSSRSAYTVFMGGAKKIFGDIAEELVETGRQTLEQGASVVTDTPVRAVEEALGPNVHLRQELEKAEAKMKAHEIPRLEGLLRAEATHTSSTAHSGPEVPSLKSLGAHQSGHVSQKRHKNVTKYESKQDAS